MDQSYRLCYKAGMLDQLTIETFEPHVGSSFWAEFPNGAKVELRLDGVGRVMESELARLSRQAFSLYFSGPKSYLLKQSTYHLSHETMEPMDIFIVPVGEDRAAYQYEAVFT